MTKNLQHEINKANDAYSRHNNKDTDYDDENGKAMGTVGISLITRHHKT